MINVNSMTKEEKELRENRNRFVDEMKSITAKANSEGRKLTAQENKEHKRLFNKIKKLTNRIERKAGGENNLSDSVPVNNLGINNMSRDNNQKWIDPNTGNEVPVLNSADDLYQEDEGWDDFDISNAIRALATGDYTQARNEINAMDLSGNTALIPTPISQRLVDRARDMMVLNQLGMKTVPMTSSTLTFAKVDSDGDPNTEWKAENASFTNSDVGISGVQLSAKTIISGVTLSHELASDSPNASQVVEDTIAKAIAGEIDRAGLLSSGTGEEPQGIFGHSGVTDTALDATPTYDHFSSLYFRLQQANENPNGLVAASRTMENLDQLKDGQGRYLTPPQSWNKFTKASTNAIPTDQGTGNNESIAIMGDYTQLFQGIREKLQIDVSRTASDDSSDAWTDLQVKIRVFSRVDFAIARTSAFQTVSGILKTSA